MVVFSIIAVACCVLLNKKPSGLPETPKIEEGAPENPKLMIPEITQPALPRPSEKLPTIHSESLSESLLPPSPDVPSPLIPPTPSQSIDIPVSLITIPSHEHLLTGWTQLASPGDVDTTLFDPVNATAPFSGWKLANTRTTLVSTTGSVTKPRFTTQGLSPMLVNAANSAMHAGGGGTNRAFSTVVHRQGWLNSREDKEQLEVGECTAGKWINRDGSNNDMASGQPAFFAQLLGPMASSLNNDPEKCFQVVSKAYENCFNKALEKGSRYVQLPLISSSIYAPPHNIVKNGHNVRELWINAVKAALVTAAQNFATKNPNSEMIIVVTDITDSPLG